MSTSGTDTTSIQQLWEQSQWGDLIQPLDAAIQGEPYSGQELLILCALALGLGRGADARSLVRRAMGEGLVSRQEALEFLVADTRKSLAKVRDGFEFEGGGKTPGESVDSSALDRWYRIEGPVWVPKGRSQSSLADVSPDCGRLIDRLSRCIDRSVGSVALDEAVADSGYAELFAPALADVLRPLSAQFNGLSVLVLDCQGGVVARFLAERGASVTAVTDNPEHALFTEALCAGLSNVQVVLEAPHSVPFKGRYDLVVIAGYQEAFLAQSEVLSPLDHLLENAYAALTANGSLLLAGHNALALRHFDDQRDAYGREGNVALEGGFDAGAPQLLSPSAVAKSLARCGFVRQDHCAFMGALHQPRLVVSPLGCELPVDNWNLATLVRRSLRDGEPDRLARFSESRVMQAAVKSGELQAWSDGYLFLAHKSPVPHLGMAGWLASHFSRWDAYVSSQERRFRLVQSEELEENKGIEVLTVSLSRSDPGKAQRYINGEVHRDNLDDLLQVPGWTFEQVLHWGIVWLRCLLSALHGDGSRQGAGPLEKGKASDYQGHYDLWVPEGLLSATPDRWIMTPEGNFQCLRQAWDAEVKVPMAAVLYAGMTSSFSSIGSVAEPADNRWLEPEALASALMERLGYGLDQADLDRVQEAWQRINQVPWPQADYFQSRERPRSVTDSAKLYWATQSEGFSEEKTSTAQLMLDGRVQELQLRVASPDTQVTGLRFDVANRPGCFELEGMSVTGSDGKVLWCWSHSSDELSGVQGVDVLTDREKGRSCLLSRGNDPQFQLNLPESVLEMAAGGELQVKLSAWPQWL